MDVCIPTRKRITERRSDLMVIDKNQKKITVYEVACAWDPGVVQRELQKKGKYQNLAADLAK